MVEVQEARETLRIILISIIIVIFFLVTFLSLTVCCMEVHCIRLISSLTGPAHSEYAKLRQTSLIPSFWCPRPVSLGLLC